MNQIFFDGRIVANAEKKLSSTGREFLTFRMANNEKDKNGNQITNWYNVTSFNHIHLTPYLTKGKPLIINGYYSDSIYQNREGKCDISRDVLAYSTNFIDSGNNNRQNTNSTATQDASPVIQTKMEAPKPTTAEIKVPTTQPSVSADEDDDLPF